jgi:hypothetical protein
LIHQLCDRLEKFQGEEPIWYGKRASKGETEGECQGYDALRCLNAHNIAMQINHRRSKASAERNPQWDPFRPRCLRSDPILRSPPPSAIYRAVHLRMRRRGAGNDIQPIWTPTPLLQVICPSPWGAKWTLSLCNAASRAGSEKKPS